MNYLKQAGTAGWLALAVLTGCGSQPREEQPAGRATEPAGAPGTTSGWELLASGEGTALRLVGASGAPVVHLFCPAGSGRLLVNVASFKPIGSEERLSVGGSGDVVALVADSRGDALRGGVSGEGPVPAELGFILAGPVSVSYGAESVGPLPRAPQPERDAFVAACRERQLVPAPAAPDTPVVAPCQTQDGNALPAMRLRAVGTEPFWGARIEGRCVTYSTPENQAGTRVWTRFSGKADGGIWSGALDGRQFELRTRKSPGCSDGMSDNRYPVEVTLRVRGETRKGCAKPA